MRNSDNFIHDYAHSLKDVYSNALYNIQVIMLSRSSKRMFNLLGYSDSYYSYIFLFISDFEETLFGYETNDKLQPR